MSLNMASDRTLLDTELIKDPESGHESRHTEQDDISWSTPAYLAGAAFCDTYILVNEIIIRYYPNSEHNVLRRCMVDGLQYWGKMLYNVSFLMCVICYHGGLRRLPWIAGFVVALVIIFQLVWGTLSERWCNCFEPCQ